MSSTVQITPAQEEMIFLTCYARAMHQWAHVENALSQVACAGVPGAGGVALAMGLYAIESFRSKLAFVDVALRQRITDTAQLEHWDKLKRQAETAAKRRNALAHRSMLVYTSAKPGKRYALLDWKQRYGEQPEDGSAPAGAISIRELVECRYLFTPISLGLDNFAAKIEGIDQLWSSSEPMQTPTLELVLQQEMRQFRGVDPWQPAEPE